MTPDPSPGEGNVSRIFLGSAQMYIHIQFLLSGGGSEEIIQRRRPAGQLCFRQMVLGGICRFKGGHGGVSHTSGEGMGGGSDSLTKFPHNIHRWLMTVWVCH